MKLRALMTFYLFGYISQKKEKGEIFTVCCENIAQDLIRAKRAERCQD